MAHSRKLTRRSTLKGLGIVTAAATAPAVLSAAEPEQSTFERVQAAHEELRNAMIAHYGDGVSERVTLPEDRHENEAAFVLVSIDKCEIALYRTHTL